jgi:hypothetical protein
MGLDHRLRDHIVLAVVVTLLDLALWAAFSVGRPGSVDASFWQAVFVLDTLIVVWIYTYQSQRQADVCWTRSGRRNSW